MLWQVHCIQAKRYSRTDKDINVKYSLFPPQNYRITTLYLPGCTYGWTDGKTGKLARTHTHGQTRTHANKMAAMFGGSGLHHGQQEEVAPVKRNFVLPRKVSLVELTEAAEVRAPAPTPPANPHAGQVVVESLSGVGGWAAKFGSGKQKTPPTVRRRRGSVDDLTGAVTSSQVKTHPLPPPTPPT